MRSFVTIVTIVLLCLSGVACRSEDKTAPLSTPIAPQEEQEADKRPETKATDQAATPPGIPVTESFDREPQLSLFARVARYRPSNDDREGLGSWTNQIDLIQRTSGMRPKSGRDDSNGWVIHGIEGISPVSFFAPLAVKPATRYHITFDFKGDFPQGASAGVSILEFKEFLWIGNQFTEELNQKYQSGATAGITIKSKGDWQRHSFFFTTSPQTGMIHIILSRDGVMDEEKPVFFDNITINEVH